MITRKNLNELYECKIIKISNKKDTLRVSIKDLKKNPWITFKDKFKINSILEDLDILEVENENIIIDSYQGCKAFFPIKLVSENNDNQTEQKKEPRRIITKKIGRNEPCPCGSGKKYKYCCGAL